MAGRPRIVSVRAPSVGAVARGELLLHSAALQNQPAPGLSQHAPQTIPAVAAALQNPPAQQLSQSSAAQTIPALAQALRVQQQAQHPPAETTAHVSIPALAQALQHAPQQNAAGPTNPVLSLSQQAAPQSPSQPPVTPPASGEPQFPPLHNPAQSASPKIISQSDRRPGDYSALVAIARQDARPNAAQALREQASADILPMQRHLENPIQLPGHDDEKKAEKKWSLENAPYRLGKLVRGLFGGNLGS